MQSLLKQNLLRRTLTAWLAVVLAITQFGFSPASAQTAPDLEPPIIELEAILEADVGNTQVFTALVADDKILKDVTLYHRRAGQQAFERSDMLPLGTIGYFSVELPTDPTDLRTIEYYIQARDEGGNRTINGFAFEPHQRVINAGLGVVEPVAPQTPLTQATVTSVEAPTEPTQISNRSKWIGIGLAVLIGALAASSSGGSSGSGDDPNRTELTINLPLPQ